MAQTTTAVAAIGTAAAYTAGGPMAEVFGELALVQAIMGFGGGAAMAVNKRESISTTLISGALGATLAVGFGVIAESVLAKVLGIPIGQDVAGPRASAAYSFAVGLGQRPIYEWFSKKTGGGDAEK